MDIELRPYIKKLCDSLAASMIRDRKHMTVDVTVSEGTVKADMSVSLGLIITELVINALKHAFPRHRSGKIAVNYQSVGDRWTLAVSDNGIGMHAKDKPGLGTTLIEALAKQLRAKIHVSDAGPGTTVSIAFAGEENAERAGKAI